MKELEKQIAAAVQELFQVDATIELTRPEEKFGDYATNVALQVAKQLHKKPHEIADALATKLHDNLAGKVADINVAGPGFVNIKLNDQTLLETLKARSDQSLAGQVIVAEYSDPNPFKTLHAGHLYTSVVGDVIANLLEFAGAKVHRVNYGGDVGLHVAKAMWGILQELGGEDFSGLSQVAEKERTEWLSRCYVEGNMSYEKDNAAKSEIIEINKRVYQVHASDDKTSSFAKIYWRCRKWSYDSFDELYQLIGIKRFEKYYPESQVAPIGLKIVKEHIGDTYEKSQGAVVFNGEKYGLHTRVFITAEGLPTYEAKEVGVLFLKKEDFPFDRSIVITANEIDEYMKVVFKSVEQFEPELVRLTTHLTHGIVKLSGGQKMSSRLGNILGANDILAAAKQAIEGMGYPSADETYLGAIKYAFLKQRIGGDIVYDPKESVSLEGNSGPYLQYAHARACSILNKAATSPDSVGTAAVLEADERSLARKISEYTEVVKRAVDELMPHHITTYLYELAQSFNRFYEHNRVIGDHREQIRLNLVTSYAVTLKAGLNLLGIKAPDKM